MKITELKQVGKGSRYKLYLDYNFVCILELEIIYKFHLKEGMFVDDEQLNQIREQNDMLTCSTVAIAYISKGIKTEKQVRDYLSKKTYLPKSINNTILKLKEYGYLNDEYFAEAYKNYAKSNKGKLLIKRELIGKGVSENIINNTLENLGEQTEEIKYLITKKIKQCDNINDIKQKQKLIRYLISKGYEYEQIKHALAEFMVDVEEE